MREIFFTVLLNAELQVNVDISMQNSQFLTLENGRFSQLKKGIPLNPLFYLNQNNFSII